MLKTLFNQADHLECSALLRQSAIKLGLHLYSEVSDVEGSSDISIEAGCVLLPGYRLIRVDGRRDGEGDGFEIAFLDDLEASVVYYLKAKVAHIPESPHRPAIQSFVWRSADARHTVLLREVAHNLFFKYLVERYDVILSDNQKAGVGKSFWIRQVSRSIAFGLCVSYQADGGQLQPLSTQDELNSLVDRLWSEDDRHRDHLVLISKGGCLTERCDGPSAPVGIAPMLK